MRPSGSNKFWGNLRSTDAITNTLAVLYQFNPITTENY